MIMVARIRGQRRRTRRRRRESPNNNDMNSLLLFFVMLVVVVGTSSSSAFQCLRPKIIRSHQQVPPGGLYVVPLTKEDKKPAKKAGSSPSISSSKNDATSDDRAGSSTNPPPLSPLLDWTASGTIGSLLMQMQKKEEEMRKLNKTLLDEEQVLDLSLNATTTMKDDASATNAIIDDDENENDDDGSNGTRSATTTVQRRKPRRLRLQRDRQQRIPKQDELISWMQQAQSRGDDGTGLGSSMDSDEGDDSDDLLTSPMDAETAKELDEAVSIRISSSIKDVIFQDLPELYRILRKPDDSSMIKATTTPKTTTKTTTSIQKEDSKLTEFPPLSRKEHYNERIGRDMRYLAVSIASSVDKVAEWRLYCQQSTGGVMPLVQCIREGARSVREGRQVSPPGFDDLGISSLGGKEECFLAAVSACRALRDLYALSLDLAAVITDDLLRAHAASRNKDHSSLLDDLCTLLRYSDDLGDVSPKKRKQRLLSIRRGKSNDDSRKMPHIGLPHRPRKETRLQCKLYVTQLLLAMTCASDSAVDAIRYTEGLQEVLLSSSSYARKERRRRWLRYPGEVVKYVYRKSRRKNQNGDSALEQRRRPFIEAASLTNDMNGRIQGTANQILAAIGYNEWVPKIPGQKGLRILCLDGGGSRGMTSVVALKCLVDSLGGVEVADCFDMVVGTSTGAIIAFLVGLKLESSEQAVKRYDALIEKIFTKSAFSTPMLLFTTASYDEAPFMTVLSDILGDQTMLDSRANPAVPFVSAVTSKMSSTPTHVALFRNYNYNRGELPDPFMIKPDDARENLGLSIDDECEEIKMNNYVNKGVRSAGQKDGSRHPGSFRVLQRYALRATTAAPTVFKPVLMGGEMYCDGGIVASNPSAIGIHEARTLFPGVPIELVVSLGTGGFMEQKSAPRIGWDGIIGQIVNSATDAEGVHHILEDILGEGGTAQLGRSSVSNTQYMRFNPILGLPDEFPIDVTDPEKLEKIKKITIEYMEEPEQQRKLQDVANLLQGREGFRTWLRR